MTIAVFVDPVNCAIKQVQYEGTSELLPKCKEFIGTTDLGHCVPIPASTDGIICGNFHDDWGLDRQFYGIIIKGYHHPIMGPSCFYAERYDTPFDFPFNFIPGVNLLWMMKDPQTMTIIRRPEDHKPPEDLKTLLH